MIMKSRFNLKFVGSVGLALVCGLLGVCLAAPPTPPTPHINLKELNYCLNLFEIDLSSVPVEKIQDKLSDTCLKSWTEEMDLWREKESGKCSFQILGQMSYGMDQLKKAEAADKKVGRTKPKKVDQLLSILIKQHLDAGCNYQALEEKFKSVLPVSRANPVVLNKLNALDIEKFTNTKRPRVDSTIQLDDWPALLHLLFPKQLADAFADDIFKFNSKAFKTFGHMFSEQKVNDIFAELTEACNKYNYRGAGAFVKLNAAIEMFVPEKWDQEKNMAQYFNQPGVSFDDLVQRHALCNNWLGLSRVQKVQIHKSLPSRK